MIPARIEQATRFLGAPADWDEARDGHCGTLPVADAADETGPFMVSMWEPLPDELERLKAGAMVVLTVRGRCHPPVGIQVGILADD